MQNSFCLLIAFLKKGFFSLLLFFLFVHVSLAQTAWTGAANNTSWSDVGNWSAGVPTATSNVTINSVAFQPVIDLPVTINSLTINASATVLVNVGGTLLVANNVINNGTLTLNNGDMTISGNFTNTATGNVTVATTQIFTLAGDLVNNNSLTCNGTLNLTKAGTAVISGTGTTNFINALSYTSAQVSFNQNTTISQDITITPSTTINIGSGVTLTLQASLVNNGTINCATGSTIDFTTSSNANITGNNPNFQNLNINKTGGSLNINTNTLVQNALTHTAGTLVINTGDLNVLGAINNNATLQLNATRNLTCQTDFTNNGTFTATSPSAFILTGTANQTISGSGGFIVDALNIAKTAGIVNFNQNLTLAQDLTIPNNVTFNVGAGFVLATNAHIINNGTFTNSGTQNLTNTGTQTISGTGTTSFATLSKTNGILTFAKNITIQQNFTIANTLTTNVNASLTLTLQGNLDNTGVLNMGNNSTLVFSGSGGAIFSGGGTHNIQNLTINKNSASLTLNATITINGDLNVNTPATFALQGGNVTNVVGNTSIAGTLNIHNNRTLTTSGNLAYAGTIAGNNNASIVLQGTANQLISGTGSCNIFAFTLSKTVGNVTLNAVLAITGAGNSLTVPTGVTFVVGALGDLGISQNLINDGTFNANAGSIVRFINTNNSTIAGANASTVQFHHLISAKTPSNAANVLTINANKTVNGDLSILANSRLTVNAGITFTIEGNISNAGNGFTLGNNAVLIAKGNFVNNGTFTNTNNSTVSFEGNATQIISGTVTPTFPTLSLAGKPTSTTLEVGRSITITNLFTIPLDIVVSLTANPTLTCSNGIVNNGTLNITQATVTISTGDFTNNNTTNVHTTNVTSTFNLNGAGGSSFINAGNFNVNNGTVNFANLTGNWTNNGTVTWFGTTGTVTFTGANPASISGTGLLNFNGLTLNKTNTLTITKDIVLNASLTLTVGTFAMPASPANLIVLGNFTDNATFSAGQSTVLMQGVTAQTIAGASNTQFYNLTINNAAGITMNTQKTITNVLGLTNGLLTTTINNQPILTATATYTGGNSNASYVNGPLQKNGNATFVFPVGKNGRLGRVAISDYSVSGNMVCEYFGTNFNNSTMQTNPNPLANVSDREYWRVEQNGTTATVRVTLYWNDNNVNTTSGLDGPLNTTLSIANLRVARWDAVNAHWTNIGQQATTGAKNTQGTLTANNTYQPADIAAVDTDFCTVGIATNNNIDWRTITWLGTTADWNVASNWSPAILPATNTNVIIVGDRPNSPTFGLTAPTTTTVQSLTLPLIAYPLSTPVTVLPALTVLSGYTLTVGTGTTNGTVNNSGNITINNGGVLSCTNTFNNNDAGTVVNNGTLRAATSTGGLVNGANAGSTAIFTNNNILGVGSSPTFNNRNLTNSRGTFTNGITGTITALDINNANIANITPSPTFNNQGIFTCRDFTNANANPSTGIVNNSGTLTLSRNFSNRRGGTFNNQNTANLAITGSFNQQENTVFNNQNSATISVGTTFGISNTSSFNNQNTATVTITGNATLSNTATFTNSSVNGTNTMIAFGGNVTSNSSNVPAINISAGYVTVAGNVSQTGGGRLTNAGNLTVSGTITTSGTTSSLVNTGTLTSIGTLTTNDNNQLTNNGTLRLAGDLVNNASNSVAGTGLIELINTNNQAFSSNSIPFFGGAQTLLISKSAGTITLNNSATFTGDVTIPLNVTFTTVNDLTNPTITGNLVVNGTLNLGGHTTAGRSFFLRGDLTNNGTITTGVGSVVTLEGNSNSSISGNPISFGNLINNKIASATQIFNNITIANNLTNTTGTLEFRNGSQVTLGGNFVNNSTFIAQTNTLLTLTGNNSASISGANDITLHHVILSKTAGASVTLARPLAYNGLFTLTSGVLNTTTVNFLTANKNATITSGSANSFINGKMRKILSAGEAGINFVFPVGKSGRWARIGILDLRNVSEDDFFEAEYFPTKFSSFVMSMTPAPMLAMASNYEYWQLDRGNINGGGGNTEAKVQLFWEDHTFSRIKTILFDDLKVAHYNGFSWENRGGNPTTINGTLGAGSITTDDWQSTFSPWTFGTLTNVSNVLPITLVDFQAIKIDEQVVKLDWITSSEKSSSHFEIERSINGVLFEKIGRVDAKGNTQNLQSYQYLDKQPLNDWNYYRLKMIDLDGTFAYSPIRAVKIEADIQKVHIYPVPFDTNFQLEIGSNWKDNYKVVLRDEVGKVVFSSPKNKQTQKITEIIALPTLPTGVYFVEIWRQGKLAYRQRVLKR